MSLFSIPSSSLLHFLNNVYSQRNRGRSDNQGPLGRKGHIAHMLSNTEHRTLSPQLAIFIVSLHALWTQQFTELAWIGNWYQNLSNICQLLNLEGDFISLNDNTEATYLPWGPSQPNGGREENFVRMTLNLDYDTVVQYIDSANFVKGTCSYCFIWN